MRSLRGLRFVLQKAHRPDSRPAKRAAYREAEVRPREVQAPAAEY